MGYISRNARFEEAEPASWAGIVTAIIIVPIFFLLGMLFYSRHPGALPITGDLATQYNSQPQNSGFQSSEPEIGIGGGAPTPIPVINYCPTK